MKVAVILPAAGQGKRFGESSSLLGPAKTKIEMDLGGRPVFMRAVELFADQPEVAQIVLAVNPDAVADFRREWGDRLTFHNVTVIAGGRAERWETVQRALEAVDESVTHVAVHDAARPLTSRSLIRRVFAAASRVNAVIPGHAVASTLKRVTPAAEGDAAGDAGATDGDARPNPLDALFNDSADTSAATGPLRQVIDTVDRTDLVEVQTPQVFERKLLERAYAQIVAGMDASGVTDDAGLVERLGETVHVVAGEATNLKITTPEDLDLARAIDQQRNQSDREPTRRHKLFDDDDD